MTSYPSIDDVVALPRANEPAISFVTKHYDVVICYVGPVTWSVTTEPDSGLVGELIRHGATYEIVFESNQWLSRQGLKTWQTAVLLMF
ncbi:MAG: hypothetical protein K0R99_4974 [Microbacterium sp.]|uniref:hypothetical protein n=1 Tax=Microbacterium sp. TaxID=51671 RepID=UPI0026298DEA|nr:hypothetical protein [Microbacterium sp.]MDF2563528.1 hypothetical protein [Microbacterium sp.]